MHHKYINLLQYSHGTLYMVAAHSKPHWSSVVTGTLSNACIQTATCTYIYTVFHTESWFFEITTCTVYVGGGPDAIGVGKVYKVYGRFSKVGGGNLRLGQDTPPPVWNTVYMYIMYMYCYMYKYSVKQYWSWEDKYKVYTSAVLLCTHRYMYIVTCMLTLRGSLSPL